MDFVGAVRAGFKNYVNFRGTATRPEYWYWVLFTALVSIVANAIDRTGSLSGLFSLATLLPGLGVTVRRLRDAGFFLDMAIASSAWIHSVYLWASRHLCPTL